MIDPRLIVAVAEWVKARVPAVGDRVQPLAAAAPDRAPFVVYAGTAHDHRLELKGLTGQVAARAVLVVWHTDHLKACHLALRIVGTKADPGLHGRRAPLPHPAIDVGESQPIPAGAVALNGCRFLPESVQRDVPPVDGSEERWFAVPLEFEFVYTAG